MITEAEIVRMYARVLKVRQGLHRVVADDRVAVAKLTLDTEDVLRDIQNMRERLAAV